LGVITFQDVSYIFRVIIEKCCIKHLFLKMFSLFSIKNTDKQKREIFSNWRRITQKKNNKYFSIFVFYNYFCFICSRFFKIISNFSKISLHFSNDIFPMSALAFLVTLTIIIALTVSGHHCIKNKMYPQIPMLIL